MINERSKLKVFVTGGDEQGWALDTEVRLGKEALQETVQLVEEPDQADVIHTIWPEQLLEDRRFKEFRHSNKPIVASFSNDPVQLCERVAGLYQQMKAWQCVGQSKKAVEKLNALGIDHAAYVPYSADLVNFQPMNSDSSELSILREELNIPKNKYIIGSFQRDSEGFDLNQFKPQKGADIFLAILVGLQNRMGKQTFSEKIHILLAGPRRHWLRKKLSEHGIPWSFAGKLTKDDDYPENILNAEKICKLTNIIDLYLISSRWEGAPRAIQETIACRKKIISTDVGIASDILNADCIYENISRAIDLIAMDLEENSLSRYIDSNLETLKKNHSVSAVATHWNKFYQALEVRHFNKGQSAQNVRPVLDKTKHLSKPGSRYKLKFLSAISKVKNMLPVHGQAITIWGELKPGPYGGSSQFLKALANEFKRRGYEVLNNSMQESNMHILNSAWFDVDKCRYAILNSQKKPKVLHRIDGPIYKYRGSDKTNDDIIFQLNQEVATWTAFQSVYSWKASLEAEYAPVNPLIIRNASDSELFFKKQSRVDLKNRKIKVISTSWSSNKLKGFDTYQYLDENLDFSKYEYTFVGQAPIKFKNIKHIEPVESKKLGEYLRDADIYLTASVHDPASNSLTEALSTGLPVVYLKSGGHGELASFAGIGYSTAQEVPSILDTIVKDYQSYQLCTYTLNIKNIADQYLRVLNLEV